MGKKSRDKGRRGQREAILLLQNRDWTVLEGNSGKSTEDLWAVDDNGRTWSIEVKNVKQPNFTDIKKQAITNANKNKLPWMIMIRIPGYKSWLIIQKGNKPKIWGEG